MLISEVKNSLIVKYIQNWIKKHIKIYNISINVMTYVSKSNTCLQYESEVSFSWQLMIKKNKYLI